MLLEGPLDFVLTFVNDINEQLIKASEKQLSAAQKFWIGFCISAIYITNTLCWKKFEKISLNGISQQGLSWMFCKTKFNWNNLLIFSIRNILEQFNIHQGNLVIDDTDIKRSRNTVKIGKTHKIKDKKTSGYFNGQNIVFLLLVTPKITIPVGFYFYKPDPAISKWRKENKKDIKKKVPRKYRKKKPQNSKEYPSKVELANKLISEFKLNFPNINIISICADSLFCSKVFYDNCLNFYPNTQVISKLRSNQNIKILGKYQNTRTFFNNCIFFEKEIKIRGGEVKTVVYSAKYVYVKSHKTKRLVIALKYKGEKEFRYILAKNASWKLDDIIESSTIRWLVEVFFEDWKLNEGWAKMAMQYGDDGASNGVLLSLLCDHCLLLHPKQKALIDSKQSALTVGCLRAIVNNNALISIFKSIINDSRPTEKLKTIIGRLNSVLPETPSSKHLNSKEINFMQKNYAIVA